MRILLDESLPRALRRELRGHQVVTVPEMGWAGKTNGELLQLVSNNFDVFLTGDQSLSYQQNLSNINFAVIVLAARTNQIDDLKPLMPSVVDALENIRQGDVIRVNL